MLSVALIGPDGAGKTTISRQLEHALPLPVKYVYMGINLASSNILLPTSRLIVEIRRALGRTPDCADASSRQHRTESSQIAAGIVKRMTAWVRSYVRLANLLAEETFRHGLVWYYGRRGNLVVLDRWFFADYYASNVADKKPSLSRRIHGYVLERVYPKPDLVIYLEAPAEMLFARKGESTLEVLEWRRQKYLQLRHLVKHFAVVDASQPAHCVARDVTALINDFYRNEVLNRESGQVLSKT